MWIETLLIGMAPPFELFQSIAGAAIALVVIVVAGWFAVVRTRWWMRDDSATDAAFTLEDLRRLRREGQLTEEEYETARTAMIGAVRKAAQPDGAEIKRRVSAGIRAAQTRTAPPTRPGTPASIVEQPVQPRVGPSIEPMTPQPPLTPVQPRGVVRPVDLDQPAPTPPTAPTDHGSTQDGTQPTRSPKRPPQLG